jgi:hypothetical protein
MLILDVSTKLGPGAALAQIEEVVRGVRVAADVAYDAEARRVRRAVSERMKYPTDTELQTALDRLPGGEEGPRYRAQRQLAARKNLRRELEERPPWDWPYFYRGRRGPDSRLFQSLSDSGYSRFIDGFAFPGGTGLDVLDPVLYDALVADELARSLPERVGVRSLGYSNPFWASLFGKANAEKTVSSTAQVLEVVRDYGSKRKMAKADAAVAEATIQNRIDESDLDVELKRQRLIEAQLRNERLAIENARLAEGLSADQQRRRLSEQAASRGELDMADTLRELDVGDALALAALGSRPLEIGQHREQDDHPPTDSPA